MSSVKVGVIVMLIAGGVGTVSVALRSASEYMVPVQAVAPGVEWVEVGAVSIPMGSPLPL